MKYLFIILCSILMLNAFGQMAPKNIYGSWVKCKITYLDGSELPDANMLKYTYMKYHFASPDKFNYSGTFDILGKEQKFEINGNILEFESQEGNVLNAVVLEGFHRDTLILTQSGPNGISDPSGLKFYLVPERKYQNSLLLKTENIRSINGIDTIYNECPKIYADYNGEDFQRHIYDGMESINLDGKGAYLLASFIVSKTGVADSLKILEHVNDKFDKTFVKVFNRARNDWKPAILNGKNVAVQMRVMLKYSGYTENDISNFELEREANTLYNNKDYDAAIYDYDKLLVIKPDNLNVLYRRGICEMLLGNTAAACVNWNKIKSLGSTMADDVLSKYCK
ncbi:MAG: hypothetical protein ACHQHN_04565 [Sphingobacteriales bacterium]